MNERQHWVAPVTALPASLKPIAAMQKKHFGVILNPTRWWGRMPRLFWLVALFVGYLERRRARLDPALRSLLMTRVSQLCHCAFCIDANSLRLSGDRRAKIAGRFYLIRRAALDRQPRV